MATANLKSASPQTPSQLENGHRFNTRELRPPEGYDRLAMMMGSLPDMAIFRRFCTLSTEDLLYRQAELQELEATLRQYQKEDKQSGHKDRATYALDWDTLQRSGDDDAAEGNDRAQLDIILKIREKLKDYHDALIRHRQVLSLGPAIPLGADRNIWKDAVTRADIQGLEQ
ncbi:hypothetical protein QBC40DRAFT_78923 [Triangularia verruculosa]|uniref:DUF6594 domain-containing protein n=1 Tax=Triangularia verruculosa TaxID=2587418 RepID=A0AAN6XFW3_9PEZI|nr:hypothetical protein QBC40DRAFT_78923 [Triangularia verruculosa]